MQSYLPTFLLLLGFLFAFNTLGQDRKQLENKRKNLLNTIKKTSAEIESTQKNKKAALKKYMLLKSEVQSRAAAIETLKAEVELAQMDIERNEDVVTALEEDLKGLKAHYIKLVRQAYRYKNANRRLLFLFSADDFNDMVRRWQYLKQYHQFRKQQVRMIEQLQQTLQEKNRLLKERIIEKKDLLNQEQEQREQLNKAMENKNKQFKALSSKEKTLQKQLDKQQKQKEGLNDAIQAAIQKSFRLARKDARSLKGLAKRKLTRRETKVARGFKNQKGKLSKPVAGRITGKFGTRTHPKYKRLKIKNDGVDITTSRNAIAKAVYEGKVINVLFVPGYQNAVMVQHGDYYTVYSQLSVAHVKKGTYIKKGQRVGRVGLKDGKPTLHFQIWNNDIRLNPEHWLRK